MTVSSRPSWKKENCQLSSSRRSKNARHVWISFFQSSENICSLRLRSKWVRKERFRKEKEYTASFTKPPGRPSSMYRGQSIWLCTPDSKVYWHLLITNRSLCISKLYQQSHPLLKLPDSSCSSERGPLNKPTLSWLEAQRFCPYPLVYHLCPEENAEKGRGGGYAYYIVSVGLYSYYQCLWGHTINLCQNVYFLKKNNNNKNNNDNIYY